MAAEFEITEAEKSADVIDFCYGLVEENMRDLYMTAEDIGWNGPAKRAEMESEGIKYLIANNSQDTIGFLSYEVTEDDYFDSNYDEWSTLPCIYM